MGFFKNLFASGNENQDVAVICEKCGAQIQPATARKYNGKCAPCAQGRNIAEEKRKREETERIEKEKQRKSEQEWESLLDSLPKKASLAFTARCVRRMYSLLGCAPVGITSDAHDCIKRDITNAENAAGGTTPFENINLHICGSIFDPEYRYHILIKAQFMLAECHLAIITKDYEMPDKKFSIQKIAEVFVDICKVSQVNVGTPFPEEFNLRLCDDLAMLKEKAKNENWTDDTPVPAIIFGPLWPNGAPRGWPV
jgi:hypothetical protein